MEDKTKLKEYIAKRAKKITIEEIEIPKEPAPWYKRPLDKNEFRYELAKNGNYYIRHNDWNKTIWVGPFISQKEAEEIIDSYVVTSYQTSLVKKIDERIHSVVIDNPETFFY